MTNHYKNKRCNREKFIQEHFSEDSKIVDEFIINRGHPNGLERHCVLNNGIVTIYNLNSGKLITKILARPQQIKRYYELSGKEPPLEYENILRLAKEHNALRYNYM
jgi:hypothetical protein